MRIEWKKIVAICAFALLAWPVVAADALPRSEWHGLVSDCAQNPQKLSETLKKVSAADQAALLGEVNDAIAKMPGSVEAKAALFYAANSAAVKAAAKGNTANVLAEVFATVPPEFLTDINERFAKEIFNRTANPKRTFTDDEFVALSKNAMSVINARCEKVENAGVRETFAALMFLRASNGSPANLAETLVSTMPSEKTRASALNDWIKPAMGDGQEQSYDPMLGVAQAGDEPNHSVVLGLTGAADLNLCLLAELANETSEGALKTEGTASYGLNVLQTLETSGLAPNADPSDIGLNRVPRGAISSEKPVGGDRDGRYSDTEDENPYYTRKRGDKAGGNGTPHIEPRPYPGQY